MPASPLGEDQDDDPLSAFGTEESFFEPPVPDVTHSPPAFIDASAPSIARASDSSTGDNNVPVRSATADRRRSPLFVSTHAAAMIAGAAVVLGIALGAAMMQVRRAALPAPTAVASPIAIDETGEPRTEIAGTAGRREERPSVDPRSIPAAAAATSPAVVAERRRDERTSPGAVPAGDPRAARTAAGAAPVTAGAGRATIAAPVDSSTTAAPYVPETAMSPGVGLDALPVVPIPAARASYLPALTIAAPPASGRSQQEEVQDVLDSYREACERLDAASAATLWRGVDTRALNRAFSTLSSQTLVFDRCDIDVSGARANAICRGSLSYIRRVGDRTPQSRRLSWSFDLEHTTDRWMISGVTAR